MAFLTGADIDTLDGLVAFQTLCLDAGVCDEAAAHIAASIAQQRTLAQCIEDLANPLVKRHWAAWCRVAIAESMDEQVKFLFGNLATHDDARLAAQWCVERNDMGFDEAYVQLERWHSALNPSGEVLFPVIEDELARKAD